MLISPPFLLPRQNNESDDAWLERCMVGGQPGDGAFPLSFNLGWHGGIHLLAPTINGQSEAVRTIADGTVVYVRQPTQRVDDPSHAQNYRGWTDNGCVVIRHETEIGDGQNAAVTFFSITMHLCRIEPAMKEGRTVWRKSAIGVAGQIDGSLERKIHFEIACDDVNLPRLTGRTSGNTSTASNGRLDAVYGRMYFLLPSGTQFFAQKPLDYLSVAHAQPAKPSRNAPLPPVQPLAPVYTSMDDGNLVVSLRFAGGGGGNAHRGSAYIGTVQLDGISLGDELEDVEGEYKLYSRACEISSAYTAASARPAPSTVFELLRFGRVINTTNETLPSDDVPHWRQVRYPEGLAWVNLNSPSVRKFSDSDFPHWQQWQIIDDSIDGDSRCDSSLLRSWLDINGDGQVDPREAMAKLADPSLCRRLAKTICKFPTEWDASTIDQRWGWLKTQTAENPSPLAEADFNRLRTHIQALTFPLEKIALPASHWHFHPKEFVRHLRMCGWISARELARIYPDSFYPVRSLTQINRTPQSIRDSYLLELNRVASKYFLDTATRKAHFFGQGAVESMLLSLMIEGSASFQRNPTHASFASEDGGYYAPQAGGYLDYLNGRLGNIAPGDGPKFRGRGMKQLTGRENYSKYWVYRGWLDKSTFTAPWWSPSRPERAPTIPDPQRLSINDYNAIDAGGWYWEAGSMANHFQSINTVIVEGVLTDQAIERVTRAINGGTNGLTERIAHTKRIDPIINDEPIT